MTVNVSLAGAGPDSLACMTLAMQCMKEKDRSRFDAVDDADADDDDEDNGDEDAKESTPVLFAVLPAPPPPPPWLACSRHCSWFSACRRSPPAVSAMSVTMASITGGGGRTR